jgi:UDPglucose 6-dehydrogenase
VKEFDPKGMRESANLFEEVSFFDEPYEMMRNADAIVILTEWDLFRSLDLERVKGLIKTPTLVDLRNIYNLDEMERAGFNYFSVGRKGIVTN